MHDWPALIRTLGSTSATLPALCDAYYRASALAEVYRDSVSALQGQVDALRALLASDMAFVSQGVAAYHPHTPSGAVPDPTARAAFQHSKESATLARRLRGLELDLAAECLALRRLERAVAPFAVLLSRLSDLDRRIVEQRYAGVCTGRRQAWTVIAEAVERDDSTVQRRWAMLCESLPAALRDMTPRLNARNPHRPRSKNAAPLRY